MSKSNIFRSLALSLLFALGAGSAEATSCQFSLLSPTSTTTLAKISSIATGDVNGDGHLDAILTHEQLNKFSVLLGNADGSFGMPTTYDINDPRDIELGDFNGDGKLDFVAAGGSGGASFIQVFIGNGDGTFTGRTPVTGGLGKFQNITRLFVLDLDGDQKLDAIAPDMPGFKIFRGDGTGNLFEFRAYDLTANNTFESLADAATSDFNGDGKIDLVGINSNAGVTILLGQGDGSFVKQAPIPLGGPGMYPHSVVAGDFDGDGKSDLLVGLYSGSQSFGFGMKLFTGKGDGTFNSPVDRGTLGDIFKALITDVDADGDLDVVVVAFDVQLGRNDGAGNFTFTAIQNVGAPYPIHICDVDHDGGPDILVGDFNGHLFTVLNHCGVLPFQLTSSANPSNAGSDVTITATITIPSGGASGSLSLNLDGTEVAAGGLPSISSTTSELSLGAHAYVAFYSGDARYYATAKGLTQTVQSPPFGPPPKVRATATSPTSVDVTWIGTNGVDHYEIQRGPNIAFLSTVGMSDTPSFTDTTASSGHAYVYRVQGISPTAMQSGYSNFDLATTFVFTDATLTPASTVIKAAHVMEIRDAVNAARAVVGLGSASWTDPDLHGSAVKAQHFSELRNALDAVRSALAMPAMTYSDLTVAGTVIRTAPINELRAGLQ